MIESPAILLSIGFLHRRHYNKVVRQEMAGYGLRPLDLLRDGPPVYETTPLMSASALMRKARGYLTIIDTQYIMKLDRSYAENLKIEFEEAVVKNLPIGLLVVRRTPSAPKYVNSQLESTAEYFKSFHSRNSQDRRSLMIISVDHDKYITGMRELLEFLRSKAEDADILAATTIPDQSPAPIRVEERGGKIARISDRDGPLGAEER